jgi:hypothetical protein
MHSKYRHNPKDIGSGVTRPMHETKPHALSHANTEASDEQLLRDQQEREARARFDALTNEQMALIYWSKFLRGKAKKERTDYFPLEERRAREDGGWTFVKKEGGQAVMTISSSDMLNPDEIGQRMGWGSAAGWKVNRKMRKIDGQLMKFAVLKGWV